MSLQQGLVLTDVKSITRQVLDSDNRFEAWYYDIGSFHDEATYSRITLYDLHIPLYVAFSGNAIKSVVWGKTMQNCLWCCYINHDLQVSQVEIVDGIPKRTATANHDGVWLWHKYTL
jgi:hypothetical protein